ncbi:AlpA family phage regulatory protein [Xanthomonas campestris pv. campestris]|uniref:helix-turn-helix transcriptional regulator n=1 Tax=Xanthomonas campestris TaxID=339 RepID=UPI002AD2877F|nr:AlpA family phage regulatory protein [Xanthomonas campestris]MEA0709486.1 AlpA family phage regulatory protein [Xanthomonas campestris pv. campestris]MEA0742661.1 AlpA family phage regulatory protein [Xanthomonas campestris pv. campestris]
MNTNTDLIRLEELLAKLQLSRSTVSRMCADGRMPAPFRIGARKLAWQRGDIDQWIASQAAAVREAGK